MISTLWLYTITLSALSYRRPHLKRKTAVRPCIELISMLAENETFLHLRNFKRSPSPNAGDILVAYEFAADYLADEVATRFHYPRWQGRYGRIEQ
jgi:hypothetical protein